MKKAQKPKNVDEYISSMPKDAQPKLRQLRKAIREAAPQAQEKISYGMPYYGYHGRLVYFRLSKKHIGIYIPTPTIEQHKNDLKGYSTSKATIRFPLENELPIALIKKLVKSRVVWNERNLK